MTLRRSKIVVIAFLAVAPVLNLSAAHAAPGESSASPSPSTGHECQVTNVRLDQTTITATQSVGLTVQTVRGAGTVDLYAYTRPSTDFRLVRSAAIADDGETRFVIRPPGNTRLYAQKRGCAAGPQVVLNVRTALTLNVVRNGTRDYTFSGDSLPARAGGLIVSLYRVTDSGRQVLTAQARASETNGEWVIDRRFTGTGRFGFVVRTGQDLQNAPGSSNVRSLLIY